MNVPPPQLNACRVDKRCNFSRWLAVDDSVADSGAAAAIAAAARKQASALPGGGSLTAAEEGWDFPTTPLGDHSPARKQALLGVEGGGSNWGALDPVAPFRYSPAARWEERQYTPGSPRIGALR